MNAEEKKHVQAFDAQLTAIGLRIGHFLNYDCIDEGIDVTSPKTRKSLPLTAYELMFVSEAIEQFLQDRAMRVLREEQELLLKSLKKNKERK